MKRQLYPQVVKRKLNFIIWWLGLLHIFIDRKFHSLLIILCRFLVEVVFILRILKIELGHQSLSLKLVVSEIFHIWYFEVIFHGRLPSFEVFEYFALVAKVKVWSNKRLLRYSTSDIMRSSSIGGCLHLKNVYNIGLSYKPKFNIWVGSSKCLLRYSTFKILRSSSIGGHFPWEVVFIWSIWIVCFGHLRGGAHTL